MANTYQGVLRKNVRPEKNLYLAIPSAVVVKVGEFLSWESNAVAVLDLATEDATFIGMALGASASGETDKIPIATEFIADVTVASATYDLGAELKFSTDGSLEASSSANGVANVIDYYSSAATTVRAYFNVLDHIKKLFPINA